MRGFPVDVAIAGNPATSLTALKRATVQKLSADKPLGQLREARAKEIADDHNRIFQTAREKAAADASGKRITKKFLSYCLGQAIDDDTVIFNEYDLDPFLVPRRLTDSWFENSVASGLGWSLGAALGGQLASPDQTIVATLGDGSYMFNTPLSAHYVAAAYDLPILIVVFNDSAWSTIKMSVKGSHKDGHAVKKREVCPLRFRRQRQI